MCKKVFCYGDSNTYGYDPVTGLRHPKSVRWTGILQKKLGAEYEVVEQGCNGRTTVYTEPGTVWKAGDYALEMCLSTYRPIEIMILMLGTNDLKDYFHASAAEIARGAESIVVKTKKYLFDKTGMVPEIILVSPIEIGEGISNTVFGDHFEEDAVLRSKEFPALYEAVAKRQGCHFLDAAKYAKPSKVDCLHMMPEDHEALANAMYDAVMALEK